MKLLSGSKTPPKLLLTVSVPDRTVACGLLRWLFLVVSEVSVKGCMFPILPFYIFIAYLSSYLFIYLFLDRGERKEKEREKYQCVVASCAPPTEDPARNPGMCPNWESNLRPFGLQASAQPTEPHQPGHQVLSDYLGELFFPLYFNFPRFPSR